MLKVKVGVFDSGVGGLSVVKAIQKELPDLEIVYKDDAGHVPYGTRSIEEIYSFVKPIFQSFVDEGCKVIVIACNTVTTNLASRLRTEFPVPMVGMEPMVKPAYQWLKDKFAKGMKVLEPDCSDWTRMIENNSVDRERIAKIVNSVCESGADQIVLGCTHYHWIEQLIKSLASGRAEVIQPEVPVIEQLKRVLKQLA